MNLVYPNEVTPPEGHAIVQKLAAEINSDCVLEKVEIGGALMERFYCYYNVAHVVQEKGALVRNPASYSRQLRTL